MLYYPINTFKPHSTNKVKLYFVEWVEFYLLGGIVPRDHLVTLLSGALVSKCKSNVVFGRSKIKSVYFMLEEN